jgi:hypothetical protein
MYDGYLHPPQGEIYLLLTLLNPRAPETSEEVDTPSVQMATSPSRPPLAHPIDRILARIGNTELYTKYLVVSFFQPQDIARLRKSETQLAAVGRRVTLDVKATEACFHNGALALREQDLVSVQLILTTPLTFRMDEETDQALHRESFQVVTGDKPKNHTYLTQPLSENEAQLLQYTTPTPSCT